MSGTRLCIIIGSFALTNLFVLYYQTSGPGTDNGIDEKDVISGPLAFHRPPSSAAYVEEERTQKSVPLLVDESLRGKRAWELFDASACVGHEFRVYLHQQSPKLSNSSSTQALTQALESSPYATKDLKEACLFVYLAHSEENLEELSFWNRNGESLLIIFVNGPPSRSYPNRRAFFVGLDVQGAPLVDLQLHVQQTTTGVELPLIYPFQKRQYLLNVLASRPTKQLVNHFSESMFKSVKVDFECKSPGNKSMGMCDDEQYRAEQLKDSIFTLLHPEMEQFARRLHEALLYGSIPVLLGDAQEPVLPFHDLIRWKRAIFTFPPHYISKIQEILPEVQIEQILEMRRNGRFYLENYLLGPSNLIRSILTAYRHRLGLPAPLEKPADATIIHETHHLEPVQQKRPLADLNEQIHFSWNENPVYMDMRPAIPIRFMHGAPFADMEQYEGQKMINKGGEAFRQELSGNYPTEKFTVIMVAYKRDEQITYTLGMLNRTRFIDRILIVWNDIGRQVPATLIPPMDTPVFVVNASRNSLNNRFLPFELIRTEAVFNMDDDFNTEPDTIEHSFRVWRENRFALVGPNFRIGYMNKQQRGVYEGATGCQQNMVLTSGAFLHRLYHRTYPQLISPGFLAHIDKLFNCEDIAINFLVAHLTRRAAVKTTPILNTSGKHAGGGLHSRGNSHYTNRAKCIATLVKEFGYNALIVSEYRHDSMHHEGNNFCYKTT